MDLSNYIYSIENKTLILSKYIGKDVDIKIDLEDLPNIDKVIVDFKCFKEMKLKSITFSDINVELDGYSFVHQKELQKVKLPKQLKIIPTGCFCDCIKLNDINLRNIERIESYAFAKTIALKKIDLLHCKEIGPWAFINCGIINQANIQNVEHIMRDSFSNCYFKNVTLNKIKKIDQAAFSHTRFNILTINNECSIYTDTFLNCESRAIKILKPVEINKSCYVSLTKPWKACVINSNYYNSDLDKLDLKVVYRESIEKLKEKGFDIAQINQIIKGYEKNIFLSDINIEIPFEILRKLRIMYEKNPPRTQYLINKLSDKSITLEEKIDIYKKIDKIKPTTRYLRQKER